MEQGTTALSKFLAEQELRTVRDVDLSMMNLRSYLKPAGREALEPFHMTYHAVTSNISDKLDMRSMLDMTHFKEPEVLNYATSTFYPLYTENLIEPKVHWSWINDERTAHVDKATLGTLGYLSHIGGDLSLTVHSLRKSGQFSPLQIRNYLRHDYSLKIDSILWRTAHQVAPILTGIDNAQARRSMTNTFMLGVMLGRQIALADSRKMAKAKSEDAVESIANHSRTLTDKVAKRLLGMSVELNIWLNQDKSTKPDIDTRNNAIQVRRVNASRRLAGLVNASLKRAA